MNDNGSKHGTVNIASGEGDGGGGDDNKTTKTSSTPSAITDNKPSYNQLFATAKLAGVVNVNVGAWG